MTLIVRTRFLKAEGTWFDYEYFDGKHLPLLRRRHARHGLLEAELRPGAADDEHANVRFVYRDEASFVAALNDMDEILRDLARATNATMDLRLEQFGETELGAEAERRARRAARARAANHGARDRESRGAPTA
ncbi:hypothetical protein SAMN05444336_103149 [Albimonas donghaensis]|uniref:EthD domain-containing protein n=1 Tax=Albimonas donghaensis TaxID=356660 RepID=A0A1H2YJQ9_9RHOB|nr:hypothetical protein [Albimonas donghaensis]SDX05215.1 hypothetical protein SAMN05444336_103149 [Albimonas donghaensis]